MHLISITERASVRIKEILVEQGREDASLRVYVQGGGCSGFQYGLVIDEGTGNTETDQVFEVNGVRLLVDPISIRYLQGAEIDFVPNNLDGDFSINNPSAKSTCGCGSSFKA
jgi:iron-sulfur cluster assembly accessory protein